MSQYRVGVLGGMGPRVVSSSISFVLPGRQNSFIPLLLLSKWNPLRWASIWGLRPVPL